MGFARSIALAAAATALLVRPGAASLALVEPDRSYAARADVLALGLTGGTVAVAVDETRTRCPQVELWFTSSNVHHRFRSTLASCKQGLSTGFGLTSVEATGTRALWIQYAGGNTREWMLWTGSTESRPKQLRLVRRSADSSDPPPVVLGPGTARGVPFAVGRQVTYFGANGKPIFRSTVRAPVIALAAGPGPKSVEVAALLADGWVVGLDGAGQEYSAEPYPPGRVKAVRVTAEGIAVHSGREVEITRPRTHDASIVTLPADASMVDADRQRILYVYRGDLWAARIASGERSRLVDATPARPALGQLSPNGFAWARGRDVAWRAGALP